MRNQSQNWVNPKKFFIEDFSPMDKSERPVSREQNTIDVTELATEMNVLRDIMRDHA